MKKLILIAFLALSASLSFAQTKEQTEEASVKALSDHGYLTLFIGKNFNRVSPNIDMYMQTELGYSATGEPKVTDLHNGTYSYQTTWTKQVSDGEHQPISFIYTLTDAKNIEQVKIKGNWVDLAELFLFYWPTKVDARELKEKRLAQCNLLSDKIIYQATGNDALITISETKTEITKSAFIYYLPQKKYTKGPRGGCYYINSKGKKVYVDRSYCK